MAGFLVGPARGHVRGARQRPRLVVPLLRSPSIDSESPAGLEDGFRQGVEIPSAGGGKPRAVLALLDQPKLVESAEVLGAERPYRRLPEGNPAQRHLLFRRQGTPADARARRRHAASGTRSSKAACAPVPARLSRRAIAITAEAARRWAARRRCSASSFSHMLLEQKYDIRTQGNPFCGPGLGVPASGDGQDLGMLSESDARAVEYMVIGSRTRKDGAVSGRRRQPRDRPASSSRISRSRIA